MSTLHTCRFCGVPKPAEAFHRHPYTRHNIDPRCKQCKRERRLAKKEDVSMDIEQFDPFEIGHAA